MKLYIFYLISVITVITSLLVITRKNVIHSAIFLILTLLSISGLYFLIEAEFLAVVQILVYAGAIITMFIFVIMSIGSSELKEKHGFKTFFIAILGFILLFGLLILANHATFSGSPQGLTADRIVASGGNIQVVGYILLTEFLFPFEVLSFILLAAMIGVFVLTRKENFENLEEEDEE